MKDITKFNIANVFCYLRKVSGLTQKEFGRELGWSKYKVSRMENAKTFPNIDDMEMAFRSDLLSKYQLSYYNFTSGKVIIAKEQLQEDQKSLFTLPDRFLENSNTKGKLLRWYIDNFIATYGVTGYIEFCKNEKVDPCYFANLSNDVNMLFVQRMLQELRKKKFLETQYDIENFCRSISANVINMSHNVRNRSEPLHKVVATIEEVSQYEENHHYEICEVNDYSKDLVVSFLPKEHISWELWAKDPLIGGLAESLIGNILVGIAGNNYRWQFLERADRKEKSCKVKISQL